MPKEPLTSTLELELTKYNNKYNNYINLEENKG
jgi:hypothetical protein